MEGALFAAQRTLGLVCGSFPFFVHTEGQITFLSLPLGNSFLTYYTEHLQIRYVGPALDRTVNAVAAYKDLILVASGSLVSAWHKVKQVRTFQGSVSAIADLFVFGEYLLAFNFSAQMLVWNVETEELLQTIALSHPGIAFAHPPTYLNKVLVATKRRLSLYNVKTAAQIYDYPELSKQLHSDLTALDPAPALDLVGLGTADGSILVWNVKTDSEVLALKQEQTVTSLSFATGTEELLVTGDSQGLLYLWNLPERRLQATIVAHPGSKVDKVQFLPREPVFVSASGGQNSIKQYIIEENQPRLLRERCGFHSPPTALQFYDDKHVLAISDHQLRDLALLNEHQSCDFSHKFIQKILQTAHIQTSLKPFRAFACSPNRERDWCNVLTCHFSTSVPVLWSYENKVVGTKAVELKNSDSEVTAVEVSACGTFGVAGLGNGKIEKFTMQSGMHFVEFQGQHEGQVTGVKTDALNRVLASGGVDGMLKFWSFPSGKLITEIALSTAILFLELDRHSFLLAVATSTQVLLYDLRTYQLARSFLMDNPAALAFGSESRWLAGCSARWLSLWDIPSARLIDWVEFESVVTGVAFSPIGSYLATTHEGSLGVFLWKNRAFSETIVIESTPEKPRAISGFDVAKGKDFYSVRPINIATLTTMETKARVEMAIDALPDLPEHKDIALSSLPHARIVALNSIDEIKERNRPIQPPKKANVPFFLPDSLNIVKEPALVQTEDGQTHFLRTSSESSELGELLSLPATSLLERFKTFSPSKIELLVLQLTGDKELTLMMEFFRQMIGSKREFDMVQSLLQCFLRAHGQTSAENCKEQLRTLTEVQRKVWRQLESEFMRDISGLSRASGLTS